MRIEPFLQVIDELDDKYVVEAVRYKRNRKAKVTKWLTIAACICLFLGVGIDTYGIYYKQGRSLYVQEHETGERRKLYRAGLFDSSHIGFILQM